MSAKLKVKLGHIEIECEGTEEFVKGELPALVKSFSELAKTVPIPPAATGDNQNGNRTPNGKKITLSVGTIATKLNASSGPDLVVAAAAYLTLVQGKDTFSRKEILTAMKEATNHYADTMSGNLTRILASTVSDNKIIERSTDVYALTAATRIQMEGLLGQE
jgi:hypothetical protein